MVIYDVAYWQWDYGVSSYHPRLVWSYGLAGAVIWRLVWWFSLHFMYRRHPLWRTKSVIARINSRFAFTTGTSLLATAYSWSRPKPDLKRYSVLRDAGNIAFVLLTLPWEAWFEFLLSSRVFVSVNSDPIWQRASKVQHDTDQLWWSYQLRYLYDSTTVKVIPCF